MKAKDTVMSDDQILQILYDKVVGIMPFHTIVVLDKDKEIPLLEAQAEISFKMGKEEGKKDRAQHDDSWHWLDDGEDHLESLSCLILIEADDLRGLIAEGKQAGIKEVVEDFALEMENAKRGYFAATIERCLAKWQGKLEEWGIE